MVNRDDRRAFLDFYTKDCGRLKKKAAAYNRKLRKEPNGIIAPFAEDLADLNEGGKLLRGTLVDLGYRLAGGGKPDESAALALAFEIFQTGVLIHDDIIDNAVLRRGKLTVQRRYSHRLEVRGTKMVAETEDAGHIADSAAICVGDLGICHANYMIAKSYIGHPALGALISYFDEVIIDTIRGELLDVVLPYELQDNTRTEEEKKAVLEESVRDIYRLKTAKYSVVGPIHLGMMLAGAPADELRAMDRFAEDIGIAYQIADDILGIFADAEILGKDVGSDVSEFKQTILYMYVRTRDEEAEKALLRYYGKKKLTADNLEAVREIFRNSGALAYAQSAMNACFERSEKRLEKMKFLKEEDRSILRGFIDWCRGRRY